MDNNQKPASVKKFRIRGMLIVYDLCIFAAIGALVLFGFLYGKPPQNVWVPVGQIFMILASVVIARLSFGIYRQIWRYGGIQSYLRLITADACACSVICLVQALPLSINVLSYPAILIIFTMNLLCALTIRMLYRYAYKCGNASWLGRFLCFLLRFFGKRVVKNDFTSKTQKIQIAIVGAGRVGTGLAEELLNSKTAAYVPRCFIEVNREKIGREIYNIPVLSQDAVDYKVLEQYGIQEIVFALPQIEEEKQKELYEYYRKSGCKLKVYDYPIIQNAMGGKRHLREFDIEALLFRKALVVADEQTGAYYRGKRILITGGGGSIGSELCRQIAKMKPECLVILDVYENGAYDVQQELKIAYGTKLNLHVEIVSVCNKVGLERVFAEYKPQVVLHAAAHKHVPLMERNCIEAVENNVFGTLNTVDLSEKYGVERFIMVSTDKAVNPTNVMGATKRMCEMIVQAHSKKSETATTFSATRFGNVLGSAGSVIPLFKRQISGGGPVTLTDKRIIRYFMTIPEASQLVLQSGAMAKNGELFVLDMGKPIKILELAENMIRLSGMEPYKDIEIVETGLRPGEKLYEELLVKTEELGKTSNRMIFVERDAPLPLADIERKLEILQKAIDSGSDANVRGALREVVPTFKTPEEVNATAAKSKEMQAACVHA